MQPAIRPDFQLSPGILALLLGQFATQKPIKKQLDCRFQENTVRKLKTGASKAIFCTFFLKMLVQVMVYGLFTCTILDV